MPSKKPTIKRSNDGREIRVISKPSKIAIRSNPDGSRSLSGYGVIWNSLSQDMGNWKEKIAPGAFTESLKTINPDPLILYAHDDANILGRVSSGTATIREDSTGVRFTCQLPATSTARDVIALAERNDLVSCSFGFSVPDGGDRWEQVGDIVIRTVFTAVLYEISLVGSPAYSAASFTLRSCPAALRSKLKRNDDDEDPDDEGGPDDSECECDCSSCVDGRCEDCTDSECSYDNCLGCANQERAAHMDLIMRRFRT